MCVCVHARSIILHYILDIHRTDVQALKIYSYLLQPPLHLSLSNRGRTRSIKKPKDNAGEIKSSQSDKEK